MGQSKHTPGEWSYLGPNNVPGLPNSRYVRDGDGMPVAKVCTPERTDEEADANGRLMAAAPEMYATCRTGLEWLERYADQLASALPHEDRLVLSAIRADFDRAVRVVEGR